MLPEMFSRRSFLKGLGLCGAGLAVGGLACPDEANAARSDRWRARLHDETRLLMGTIVRITVSRASKDQAEQGMGLAFAEMDRLTALFDRHRSGTVIATLNERQSLSDAPLEFVRLVETAQGYSRVTGQAFDMTVQPVLDLMARHGNPKGEMRLSQSELAEALALVDSRGVQVSGGIISFDRSGMGITLDGVAKGHIVDQAARILEEQGLNHYVINAGGDIRCSGEKRPGAAWTVAVEDPSKQGNYQAVISMTSGAIATSGGYERYFDKDREHTHLLMPSTGESPRDCVSVTVKAPTAMQADALATSLSVMPQEAALQLVNTLSECECLFVMRNGSRVASRNWKMI